jgi:hypothetical protein
MTSKFIDTTRDTQDGDNSVIALTKMYWLLGRRSKLSPSNKNKTTLNLIWTYGTQLWGTASTSDTEILERFQSKALRTSVCAEYGALRMTVDTPRYVPNTVIQRDLQTPTVTEEIRRYSSQYSAHPNGLVVNLMEQAHNKTPAT